MKSTLREWEEGIIIGGKRVNNLRYADDTTTTAEKEEGYEQKEKGRIEREGKRFGLITRINRKKTKHMLIGNTNKLERTGELEDLETGDTSICLVSPINNSEGSEIEIQTRINQNSRVRKVRQNSAIYTVYTLKQSYRKFNVFFFLIWRGILDYQN